MHFDLEITKNCNLRCKYCFVHHEEKSLDIEKGKKIIDFSIKTNLLRKEKKIHFTFFGGEPLLCFDKIMILTEYAKENAIKNDLDISFDVTSNGTIFNEEIKEFFLKNKFNIKISLDGIKENHDKNRRSYMGNGSYELIEKNIPSLLEYQKKSKLPIQVSMVINQNTHKEFFENLKNNLEHGFVFIDSGLNYYEKWNEEDYDVFENEVYKAVEYYFQCLENNRPFEWSLITNALKMHLKKQKYHYCGAGAKYQFFSVDGSIFPCTGSQKSEVKIGHVDTGYIIDKVSKFTRYKRNLNEECLSCNINSVCSGCDCTVLSYEVNDDFRKVPYATCKMNKINYRVGEKILKNSKWMRLIENNSDAYEKLNSYGGAL